MMALLARTSPAFPTSRISPLGAPRTGNIITCVSPAPKNGPSLAPAHSEFHSSSSLYSKPKENKASAQQLIHKTLITISFLERLLTSEGVTSRSDGKIRISQHVARLCHGWGPLAPVPLVLFQTSSWLWFQGH